MLAACTCSHSCMRCGLTVNECQLSLQSTHCPAAAPAVAAGITQRTQVQVRRRLHTREPLHCCCYCCWLLAAGDLV